jgi:hypothetical protein
VTARLKGRRAHAHRLIADLTRWAEQDPGIHALCLVGSYARGSEGMASDVDVVVLCADLAPYSVATGWFHGLRSDAQLLRLARWGPVQEQRWRLRSGLLAEIGLAAVSWADVPLDAGTRRVLSDGHRILHDPHGTVAQAATALRAG